MTIGLSTYAYFWRLSDRVSNPLSLPEAIAHAAASGVPLFQICDYAPLETMSEGELAAVRSAAVEHQVTLELGTKGIRTAHLRRFLQIADILDARLLRTMFNTADHRPDVPEATALLRAILPELVDHGVTLALETYEQVPTRDLVQVVRDIGHPRIGICSDPANTVAALELPAAVVDAVAPYVVNMHIKDFAFSRRDGWVGFTFSGAPLGEGLLDYDHMVRTIRPHERDINQIVEHWLPWQGSEEETLRLEDQWTRQSLEFLRSK
ncbi:MAG TPA: TIM barrel protein [Micrococcaceae bacterium]|jgi:sugar phosphate isomerase/epimerase|nr:TIM barrel protein [Micrococcaceae bacterium]